MQSNSRVESEGSCLGEGTGRWVDNRFKWAYGSCVGHSNSGDLARLKPSGQMEVLCVLVSDDVSTGAIAITGLHVYHCMAYK